jgi:hypothetical protein
VAYRGVKEWIISACGLSESLPLAPVVAIKLPVCFDSTSLARELTLRPPSRAVCVADDRERCFPFRFYFGRSTILFIVAVAGTASRFSCTGDLTAGVSTPSLWYENKHLNGVVEGIVAWHHSEGYREHHPEFFDYDKQRWIPLKKWIAV